MLSETGPQDETGSHPQCEASHFMSDGYDYKVKICFLFPSDNCWVALSSNRMGRAQPGVHLAVEQSLTQHTSQLWPALPLQLMSNAELPVTFTTSPALAIYIIPEGRCTCHSHTSILSKMF